MHTALSEEDLGEVFDHALRCTIEQVAGIRLFRKEEQLPDQELYTVHAAFERGFNSSLSLCAEKNILIRLTQAMMQEDKVTPEDIEDFTKEFFNVVCGHIASELFSVTRVASRFGIPSFYPGRYEPDNEVEHFSIRYSSDREEHAVLTHYTPAEE